MGLTVREKEHWKARIDVRIKNRINELIANNEPDFQKRIRDSARAQAIEELGVSAEFTRLIAIKSEQNEAESAHQSLVKKLEREHNDLYEKMSIAIAGGTTGGRPMNHVYAVDRKIEDREGVILRQLMKSDPLGQQVLSLENEQENLLDTVWLATSPVQIKELWASITEMLGQTPTKLQANALAVEPMTVNYRIGDCCQCFKKLAMPKRLAKLLSLHTIELEIAFE